MRIHFSAAALVFASLMLVAPLFAEDAGSKPKFGDPNMGTVDRIVRTGIGVGLVTWGAVLVSRHQTPIGYAPIAISIIPFATAALGRCLLYYPLGIDTREKKHDVSLQLVPGGAGLAYSYRF
jgi:hypothetical protein